MKSGILQHTFAHKLGISLLLALLGPPHTSQAQTLPKKKPEQQPPKEETPKRRPKLKKPRPLQPTPPVHPDPRVALDKLLVRRHIAVPPHVPLLQAIGIATDYGRLAMHLWNLKTGLQERWYEGTLHLLFRKNIQLAATLGYNRLWPTHTTGNKSAYKVAGTYLRLGLDYWAKYDHRNHLYAGIRYGRSPLVLDTHPKHTTEKPIQHELKAFWWELIIGSEHQLFQHWGLYVGATGRIKALPSFDTCTQATNYVIPGYGRTASSVVPDVTLYIKYQLAFGEKQLSF